MSAFARHGKPRRWCARSVSDSGKGSMDLCSSFIGDGPVQGYGRSGGVVFGFQKKVGQGSKGSVKS